MYFLQKNTVKCKIPAMDFTHTDFDSSGLEYCKSKEDALEMEGLVYQLAQNTLTENKCGSMCERAIYNSILNTYSTNVLGKELKVFGDGYFIVWAFYSSLYVSEKTETYVFDFDSALIAVGGSLGLYVGWSAYTIVMDVIEFVYMKCSNYFKKP